MAMNFDLLVSLVYVVMVATITIDQSESRRSSEKPLGGCLGREARLVPKVFSFLHTCTCTLNFNLHIYTRVFTCTCSFTHVHVETCNTTHKEVNFSDWVI